jgi:hypothetical protein
MEKDKIPFNHFELLQGFMKNSQNPIKSNSCRIGSSPNSIFFLTIICALFMSGCEKPKEQVIASPPPVKVTPVMQQDVPIQQEWVGTLDGMVNAQINAQVVGYLIKQNYKEGDLVKRTRCSTKLTRELMKPRLHRQKQILHNSRRY